MHSFNKVHYVTLIPYIIIQVHYVRIAYGANRVSVVQAVDFDPDSLRHILPDAVKVVAEAMTANKKCAALTSQHGIFPPHFSPRFAQMVAFNITTVGIYTSFRG